MRPRGVDLILEENVSSISRKGREKLEMALANLRAAPGSKLVVCRLDRLSRNLKDSIGILEEIEKAGAGLKVLDMDIDTSTPHGRFFGHMLLAMAQWETELLLHALDVETNGSELTAESQNLKSNFHGPTWGMSAYVNT